MVETSTHLIPTIRRSSTSPSPVTRPGDGRRLPTHVDTRGLDQAWSGVSQQGRGIFEYYDYYYTGDNVRVYVDGVEPPDADANMPVIEFAFKISQQKTPLYGFWSYTYDEMLRGTRVVQGAIRIATTTTNYMTREIAKAADTRTKQDSDYVIRKLDVDERNIDAYWGRHIELDTESDKNIFSIHPPFNFVVMYGIDDVAACMPSNQRVDQYVVDKYNTGFGTMANDDNHTILEADQNDHVMRRVIEGVEIVDMQVEYSSNGQVCSELYSFIARDAYSPSPDSPKQTYGNTYVPGASDLPHHLLPTPAYPIQPVL